MVGCRESQGSDCSDLGLAGELFGFWASENFSQIVAQKRPLKLADFVLAKAMTLRFPHLWLFWENENKIFQNEDSDLMCRNAKLL